MYQTSEGRTRREERRFENFLSKIYRTEEHVNFFFPHLNLGHFFVGFAVHRFGPTITQWKDII